MADIAARILTSRRLVAPTLLSARGRLLLKQVAAIGVLFGTWELLTGGFGGLIRPAINTALVPPPSAAVADLVVYARSGLLVTDLATTLGAALLGLLLGMLGGLVVGLLLGSWRAGAEIVTPIFVGLNSLPRVALAPLFIVWFGLGMTSKVVVSLLVVFFVVFFNTYAGMRSIDPELSKAVRVMGATRLDTLRIVVVPAVLQWVFAALRTCVSFALTGAVVGEFVGSTGGLGYRMAVASGVLNSPRLFGILLLLGLIGTLLVEMSKRVERHLLRWQPAAPLN